jgi:hypothetical protein
MTADLTAVRSPVYERLLDRWDRYMFPQTKAVRLAVMRIIVCGLHVLLFALPWDYTATFLQADGFIRPEWITQLWLLVVPEAVLRTAEFMAVAHMVMYSAAVLACIGLRTKLSLWALVISSWLISAHGYSYGEIHHPEAVWNIFLLMLALGPAGRALSVDAWLARRKLGEPEATRAGWGTDATMSTAFWGIRVTMIVIALAYLDAGLSKLLNGGLDAWVYRIGFENFGVWDSTKRGLHWFNGYTLQHYLLQDGIRFDRPLGVWISQYKTLCQLLSVGAVAFELGFILILFFRRLIPVLLIGGVMLHAGIEVTQGATFFMLVTLYGVWVPWERLLARFNARSAPPASTASPSFA